MGKRVAAPKTRNDGTMSEAAFRAFIRSNFRRMSMRWRPIYATLKEGQRPPTDAERELWGNRVKFLNNCQMCGTWVPRKHLDVDHIVPCGSLMDIEKDAGPFLLRLLVERPGLRRLCDTCHRDVTNKAAEAATKEGTGT